MKDDEIIINGEVKKIPKALLMLNPEIIAETIRQHFKGYEIIMNDRPVGKIQYFTEREMSLEVYGEVSDQRFKEVEDYAVFLINCFQELEIKRQHVINNHIIQSKKKITFSDKIKKRQAEKVEQRLFDIIKPFSPGDN